MKELLKKFEKETELKVVKTINNNKNCIIKNARNKFILGKVYKNCISIGSGYIREFDTIEEATGKAIPGRDSEETVQAFGRSLK